LVLAGIWSSLSSCIAFHHGCWPTGAGGLWTPRSPGSSSGLSPAPAPNPPCFLPLCPGAHAATPRRLSPAPLSCSWEHPGTVAAPLCCYLPEFAFGAAGQESCPAAAAPPPASCPGTGKDAAGAGLALVPSCPLRTGLGAERGILRGASPRGLAPSTVPKEMLGARCPGCSKAVGQNSVQCPREEELTAAVPGIVPAGAEQHRKYRIMLLLPSGSALAKGAELQVSGAVSGAGVWPQRTGDAVRRLPRPPPAQPPHLQLLPSPPRGSLPFCSCDFRWVFLLRVSLNGKNKNLRAPVVFLVPYR